MKSRDIHIDSDKPFKILQFTDLHLSLRAGQKYRRLTEKLVLDSIRDEKPDLAVVTGDLVWSPYSEEIYSDFCALMDGARLPWAFCFGNHDRDYVKKTAALESILQKSEQCLYSPGESGVSGDGNYIVVLRDGEDLPKYVLYFFDNCFVRRYGGLKGLACSDFSQVDWFKRVSMDFESRFYGYKSLIFCHFPLEEYKIIGTSGDYHGTRISHEGHALVNSGLFCALTQDATVKAVFCGHDHGNDYSGVLENIELCYGKTTGFNQDIKGGGGKVSPCGVRVIVLNPGSEMDSYFYMEDNTRIDRDGNVVSAG